MQASRYTHIDGRIRSEFDKDSRGGLSVGVLEGGRLAGRLFAAVVQPVGSDGRSGAVRLRGYALSFLQSAFQPSNLPHFGGPN